MPGGIELVELLKLHLIVIEGASRWFKLSNSQVSDPKL